MDPVAAVPLPSAVFPDPFAGNPARAGEGWTARHFVTRSWCRAAYDHDPLGPPVRLTNHDSPLARIRVGMIRMAVATGGNDHGAFRRWQAAGEDRAYGEGGGEEDFHGVMICCSARKGEEIF